MADPLLLPFQLLHEFADRSMEKGVYKCTTGGGRGAEGSYLPGQEEEEGPWIPSGMKKGLGSPSTIGMALEVVSSTLGLPWRLYRRRKKGGASWGQLAT